MRSEFAFAGDVTLVNAGALHDPLVAGVDPARKLRVRHHLPRQIAAAP
jgi:hypothetical protein